MWVGVCVGWCGVGFICVRLGFVHFSRTKKQRVSKAESHNKEYYSSYRDHYVILFISFSFMLQIKI